MLATGLLAAACAKPVPDPSAAAPGTAPGTVPPVLVAGDAAPARAAPVRVLLAGDSVMQSVAPALKAALGDGDTADVRFTLSPVFHGDPALKLQWDAQLPAFDPDVIVFLVGIWESFKAWLNGYDIFGPDEDWRPRYRAEVLDPWVRYATALGARAVFVGRAPVRDAGIEARLVAWDPELQALPDRFPEVAYVRAVEALNGPAGDGFHDTVAGDDGRPVRTRQTDGVHPCAAGAERLAVAVAAVLAPEVPTRPGWQAGPWRDDPVAFPPAKCPPV